MNELNDWLEEESRKLALSLTEINRKEVLSDSVGGFGLRKRAIDLLNTIKAALFPSLYEFGNVSDAHLTVLTEDKLCAAAEQLCSIAMDILPERCEDPNHATCDHSGCARKAQKLTMDFFSRIAGIRMILSTDLKAAYVGDPAAKNMEEILLSYPSIEAVSTYRIAHELFVLGLPVVPRIMTEYAHRLTGIDIHPGATIGESFFIDHGTGVVIGETTVIGRNVKLYQGVTLGAKSFQLDSDGNPMKGFKRHPNIEDDVVIYAGATILGGDVTVGHGSVIGGNAWITHSVPPMSTVYNPMPRAIINESH